jgi:hypothetical protein
MNLLTHCGFGLGLGYNRVEIYDFKTNSFMNMLIRIVLELKLEFVENVIRA